MIYKYRKLLIASAVFIVVAVGVLGAILSFRPAMPVEWTRLRSGMPRSEVLEIIPDFTDMRETKGFETATRVSQFWGKPYLWFIQVFYDENDRLKEARTHTGNGYSSVFDRGSRSVLE